MNDFSVELGAPITVVGAPVNVLTFRPAVGRDLIGLPDPNGDRVGWALTLASRTVTNASADDVMSLPFADALAVAREVSAHLPITRARSSTDISSAPASGGASAFST